MARGMRGGAPQWFRNFQNSKFVTGTRDFLDSNTLAAKFAFIILVIIGFVIIMRLFIAAFTWMTTPSTDTYLWQGNKLNPFSGGCRKDANLGIRIPTDPRDPDGIPILRSKNDWPGMDFTWSTWIWVNSNNVGDDCPEGCGESSATYKHVFSKGLPAKKLRQATLKNLLDSNDAGPALYLRNERPSGSKPGQIDLIVLMNTYGNPEATEVQIKNLPLNKWVHVTVRLSKQTQLDTYINGSLDDRTILPGIARQNYGDVFVTQQGGYNGYIAGLRYIARAIGTSEIDRIVDAGPQSDCTGADGEAVPHYLSTRWYFAGADDAYNPGPREFGTS